MSYTAQDDWNDLGQLHPVFKISLMIIQEAKYEEVTETYTVRVSEPVHGCDNCGKAIQGRALGITVFAKETDDNRSLEFCSWRCTLMFIPKIECEFFIDLPFLIYNNEEGDSNSKEFIDLISKINFDQ